MAAAKRTRAKRGDVFSLQTKSGVAKLQAAWKHPLDGWIVRVFEPADVRTVELVMGPHAYVAIVGDLDYAAKLGQCVREDWYPVPPDVPETFLIRTNLTGWAGGNYNPSWWTLSDENTSWRVGDLSDEQRAYPDGAIIPPVKLAKLIDLGWHPFWKIDDYQRYQAAFASVANERPITATWFLKFTAAVKTAAVSAYLTRRSVYASIVSDEASLYLAVSITDAQFRTKPLKEWDQLFDETADAFEGECDGNEIPV